MAFHLLQSIPKPCAAAPLDQALQCVDSLGSSDKHLHAARVADNVGLVLLGQPHLKRVRAERAREFVIGLGRHSWSSPGRAGLRCDGRNLGEYRIDLDFAEGGPAGASVLGREENAPAKFRAVCRESPVKLGASFRGIPAKMPKRKKNQKKPSLGLDIDLEKRGRGRPPRMRASEISGRAYSYRLIFNQIWEKVGEQLLKAQTGDEAIQAFEATPYQREFEPLASLILQVLREPDFPMRDPEAQANFLGDSLAARGHLTPRSSRDICARGRPKQQRKTEHHNPSAGVLYRVLLRIRRPGPRQCLPEMWRANTGRSRFPVWVVT
jgi:hypothetical protein